MQSKALLTLLKYFRWTVWILRILARHQASEMLDMIKDKVQKDLARNTHKWGPAKNPTAQRLPIQTQTLKLRLSLKLTKQLNKEGRRLRKHRL